jgi:hypothetical protein
MKRKFIFVTTILSIFVLAGLASATVYVNVTSEPIQYQATCDKGGGFTLTFGPGVEVKHGDQIVIDLDFGAYLCRDVDFVIAPAGDCDPGDTSVGTGWITSIADNGPSSPVFLDDVGADSSFDANGVFFHLYGNTGSQRVTMDVHGVGSTLANITVGANSDDELVVKFFDQQVNADFTDQVGIWTDTDGDGVYDDAAELADNTYCINVSGLTTTSYEAHLDSKDDKFTFEPSDPTVAHAGPVGQFELEECAKVTVGTIEMGSKVVQGGETCDAFDFETGSGYCSGTHLGDPRIIIHQLPDGSTFDLVNYSIRLEILVNGLPGSRGAY